MNLFQPSHLGKPSAALALLIALGSAPTWMLISLDAQARETSSTVTGPNGQTTTRQTQREAGSVNSTVTGPDGNTATRNVNRTAEGTDASVTGPNGQTTTRSVTRTP